MNKQVIEAAIEAMQAELGDDLGWKPEGWRRVAESAIEAAMVALAPDIRKAVDLVFDHAMSYADALWFTEEHGSRDYNPDAELLRVVQAKSDLYDLLGIPEGGE